MNLVEADKHAIVSSLIGHFSGSLPEDQLPPDVVSSLSSDLAESGLLRKELIAFWKILGVGMDAAHYKLPVDSEVKLLNLACGPCFEGAVLSAFFGQPGKPGSPRNRVRFFGMDLRDREIDKAERRYAATEALFHRAGLPPVTEQDESRSRIEFFADDATRLIGYKQIPRSFDIIFLRHQNVWHDRPVWRKIFSFALSRLASDGRLIITSYFDREHLIALEMIRRLGGHLLTSRQNPDTVPLDCSGKSTDRHLAIFSREGTSGGNDPDLIHAP
ncbi:MAG: hypothetical protein AAF514_06805 [Verrucomicrobiota bacterium]